MHERRPANETVSIENSITKASKGVATAAAADGDAADAATADIPASASGSVTQKSGDAILQSFWPQAARLDASELFAAAP